VAQKELNLGILAHVDAGKTTLTERLLYEAGVIGEVGSVDAGTTQTDSLSLERERGITIRSAVTSFSLEDVHVNLIDTPGHPDFIAEVERVLGVLDGAVLVVSAVEGVQPQTRILMNALKRLRVPTLIFVNKIDRTGADDERVLGAIANRLTPAVVAMGMPHELGSRGAYFTPYGAKDAVFQARAADVLGQQDDLLLDSFLRADHGPSASEVRQALAFQTAKCLIHPVFFGSAITGAGVAELMSRIPDLLPAAEGDPAGVLSAQVFKIERSERGEKIVYVRIVSGTLQTRETIRLPSGSEEKVTGVSVFESGAAPVQRPSVTAGAVAQVRGLASVRVGEIIGEGFKNDRYSFHFSPPTLEAVIEPRDPGDRAQLAVALSRLADQDPLISVRQDDLRREVSVSLYGEVQQEVIAATLAREYGIEVAFRPPTPICVERVIGTASATDALGEPSNPFKAGIGFRLESAARGSGIQFTVDVALRSIPIYVYKSLPAFEVAMEEYVRATLEEGVFGWQVTDCAVTMTHCDYSSPGSSARDYRLLTPLVLMRAVADAGTQVCEPFIETTIETPSPTTSAVLSALSRFRASAPTAEQRGELTTVATTLPARELSTLRHQLPALSSGEGLIATAFGGYEPIVGSTPMRPRRRLNALNREAYLMEVAGRAKGNS
jgi:ribosomal protection tetracycline resistance protein